MPPPLPQPNSEFPVAIGSGNCCCGACHENIGCLGADGNSFAGACCKCVPRHACLTMSLAYGAVCSLEDVTDNTALNCVESSYDFNLQLGGQGFNNVDISIRFETREVYGEDKCVITLTSAELGYTGNDVLVKFLTEEYDQRRTACNTLDIEFDVDVSTLTGCSGAVATVTMSKRVDVSRRRRRTGFWTIEDYDQAGDQCRFSRICVTFEDSCERENVFACYNKTSGYWEGSFTAVGCENENILFRVSETVASPTTLKLETRADSGAPWDDEGDRVMECPWLRNSWELDQYRAITVNGDMKADCRDCLCWCRSLCVTYSNDSSPDLLFATFTWDETTEVYEGTFTDGDGDPAEYPPNVGIHFRCDECTGVTYIVLSGVGNDDEELAVDCDDVDVLWVVDLDDETQTVVTAVCKKCEACFLPFNIPTTCCYEPIPDTVYLTVEPGEGDGPVEPFNGSCEGISGSIALHWDVQEQAWLGRGLHPYSGCPDIEYDFRVSCGEGEGGHFSLEYGGGGVGGLDDEHTCDPISATWYDSPVQATDACCDTTSGTTGVNNVKWTLSV